VLATIRGGFAVIASSSRVQRIRHLEQYRRVKAGPSDPAFDLVPFVLPTRYVCCYCCYCCYCCRWPFIRGAIAKVCICAGIVIVTSHPPAPAANNARTVSHVCDVHTPLTGCNRSIRGSSDPFSRLRSRSAHPSERAFRLWEDRQRAGSADLGLTHDSLRHYGRSGRIKTARQQLSRELEDVLSEEQ
jgi:hypothetical protein